MLITLLSVLIRPVVKYNKRFVSALISRQRLSKTEQGYMLELLVLHLWKSFVKRPQQAVSDVFLYFIYFCLRIFYSLESLFSIYFVYLSIIYLTYYQAALYNSILFF